MTSPQAAALFAAEERWGWEYREPDTVAVPYPSPEPVPNPPSPPVTPATGWARPELRQAAWAIGGVAAFTAIMLIGLRSHATSAIPGAVTAAAMLVLALAVVVLVVSGRARLRYRLAAAGMYADWQRRCGGAYEAFHADEQDWHRRRERHDDAERTRLRTESCWTPLVPAGTRRRVDVYGGGPDAWAAWLAVTCGSLVGCGARVTVLDVSRSGAGDRLVALAANAGRPAEFVALPTDAARVDLFAGLPAEQVARLLGEAVHAAERDTTSAARGVDARVLGLVCGALGAPLTITRIGAALRVLLRQEPLPDGIADPLTVAEYDSVNTLFGETMRRQVETRVATLEALLHPLAELGSALSILSEPDAPDAPLPSRPCLLRVVTVADAMADLARELLVQLLLQITLADVRTGGEPPVLVLVGADAVPAKHLETLAESARNSGGRVVYLFGHLRGDTADLLGDADSVYLMRLGNGVEAAKAAEFIGREYRFVLHQRSDSYGTQSGSARTAGRSTGLSRGASTGLGGGGSSTTLSEQRTVGESRSTGTSTTRGTAEQRVYEFAVEPVVLQQLSDTAFVVVHAGASGGRRARFGDCDPRIAVDPAHGPQPARPGAR